MKLKNTIFIISLWVLVVAIAIFYRPLLPVDETRYLSVAWDMWVTEKFLVPSLNGSVYSHKPPLLFWLIHVGWYLFEVNDWWPRVIAPIFGLGCLFLTRQLALVLWPGQERVSLMAPLILFSCLFWTLFSTLTMFDLIQAFFALMALLGIVIAWRENSIFGFLLLGVGIGLGGLAKGPAILVHVMPAALLAPIWGAKILQERSADLLIRWYVKIMFSVILGLGIVLLWAIPAGHFGGPEYREAIFWGQTAGRITKSFAHERPFWWYLPIFPLLILPWCVWPIFWKGIFANFKGLSLDAGSIFCVIWFVGSFLIFSMISGKQLHYLLPIFPAFALIGANGLSKIDRLGENLLERALLPCFYGVLGFLVLLLPNLPIFMNKVIWVSKLNFEYGLVIGIMGFWLYKRTKRHISSLVMEISIGSAIVVVCAHLILSDVLFNFYNLQPLANKLSVLQKQGYAIANFGKYHGQYNFLGRLKKPITVIGLLKTQKMEFLKNAPNGKIVAYYRSPPKKVKPIFTQNFRQMTVVIWDAREFIKNPKLGDRRANY